MHPSGGEAGPRVTGGVAERGGRGRGLNYIALLHAADTQHVRILNVRRIVQILSPPFESANCARTVQRGLCLPMLFGPDHRAWKTIF